MKLSSTLKAAAAGLVALIAVPTGVAYADGPGLSAGTGCAAQCITKAAVTTTTTTAQVAIQTTVPANLTVTITKRMPPAANIGMIAVPSTKTVSIAHFSPIRTAFFTDLLPETTYDIVVKAVDLQSRTAKQVGDFQTRAVKLNVPLGPGVVDTGLGCSANCIQKASFTQVKPHWSSANVDVATAVDAQVQVVVSRDKPTETQSGLAQFDIVSSQLSPGFVRDWKPQVTELAPSTTYYAVVRAKDKQGRMNIRTGSFSTVKADVVVTFHKIKVITDGDKVGAGELHFYYQAGDQWAASGGFHSVHSGDVIDAKRSGTSHVGVALRVPLTSAGTVDLKVTAQECDAALERNCVVEGFGNGYDQYATAKGTIKVLQTINANALPGWYGTGVATPTGSQAYFAMSSNDNHDVEFLALASLDIEAIWP